MKSDSYDCETCQDSHFVHPLREDGKPDYSKVIPCKCIVEQLQREKYQRMIRLCELPPGAEKMTFDNFEVYPDLKEVYESARALAEGRSATKWLTLMSDTDRGKTHLLVSICRHWIEQGQPARYAYVPLLLDELRRGFQREGDYSYDSRFDFFLNVPLLALDDLGTEHKTSWVQERLDTIIDYRLMNNLGLVVTTNLTLEDLNFRIGSRLKRQGKIVYIDAPEFRNRKP